MVTYLQYVGAPTFSFLHTSRRSEEQPASEGGPYKDNEKPWRVSGAGTAGRRERPLHLTDAGAACRLAPALRGWTWAKYNHSQKIQEKT